MTFTVPIKTILHSSQSNLSGEIVISNSLDAENCCNLLQSGITDFVLVFLVNFESIAEGYLEACETSMVELFSQKTSTTDLWQGSKYASEFHTLLWCLYCCVLTCFWRLGWSDENKNLTRYYWKKKMYPSLILLFT